MYYYILCLKILMYTYRVRFQNIYHHLCILVDVGWNTHAMRVCDRINKRKFAGDVILVNFFFFQYQVLIFRSKMRRSNFPV